MDSFHISPEARLQEAQNLAAYYEARAASLAQHLMNRDRRIAELTEQMSAQDIDLKSTIAGLQDELRLARRPLEIEQESLTDGE